MKLSILSLLLAALALIACNSNKKPAAVTTEDSKTTVKADVAQVSVVSEEMKKEAEELQKLTPLTTDELKALLPEKIMGTKRSQFEATSINGTGLATAEYDLNDSTQIKVSIWDCGGPGGAGWYSNSYLTMFNLQSENDREYTHTIDFKGSKAIEHCQKDNSRCELTYFGGKRFMIVLDGKNVLVDGLKQAANELRL